MRFISALRAAAVAIMAFAGATSLAHADGGSVAFKVVKAGFVIGGSGGSGTLSFHGRSYPFTVGGLSYGITFGAAETYFTGTVSHIHSPRDIAGVWVRPLAELAVDPDRRAYLGFLAVLHSGGPGMRELTIEVFRRQQVDFDALLARALPDLTAAERWFRMSIAIDANIRVLADLERAAQPWRATGGIDAEALVAKLVDVVTSILTPAN